MLFRRLCTPTSLFCMIFIRSDISSTLWFVPIFNMLCIDSALLLLQSLSIFFSLVGRLTWFLIIGTSRLSMYFLKSLAFSANILFTSISRWSNITALLAPVSPLSQNSEFTILTVYSYFLINLYHSLGIFSRRQIDDIFLIFPRKQDLTFHANCEIVSLGDNLHEMSYPVFWEK